jgi:hypothetical protein
MGVFYRIKQPNLRIFPAPAGGRQDCPTPGNRRLALETNRVPALASVLSRKVSQNFQKFWRKHLEVFGKHPEVFARCAGGFQKKTLGFSAQCFPVSFYSCSSANNPSNVSINSDKPFVAPSQIHHAA